MTFSMTLVFEKVDEGGHKV
jgi:hypothetical protein